MSAKIPKKLPLHIYKLKNGKFRVRYRKSQKYPADFDKIYDSYDEAVDANEQYLAKVKLKVYTKSTKKDIGFSELCDIVLDWYKTKSKKPSQNTIRSYRQYMNRLKPLFKNQNIRDISSYQIEMAFSEEKERQKCGNGCRKGETISANTLHHEYATLRMLFNKAQKWKFIEENPMLDVEEPYFEEKEIIVPEYEELEEIENKIMTAPIRERIQFLLAFFGGLRLEEVSGLHTEDFDLKNKTVTIRRAIVQNDETREFEETRTKSQSSLRTIPLPDRFFIVYDEFLKYREAMIEYMKNKIENFQERSNLFFSEEGKLFRPYRLGRKWAKFAKENNINLTFHGLRHYFITNQMNYNDDVSPRDVQYLAGHSNIKTTFRYVHPSNDRINKNATSLFDKFSKEQLYKNGENELTIPIEHITTIILGDPKYSKMEELQITLTELSGENVDFFNISNIMEYCRDYLQANYPSLNRMEKYKYDSRDEKEIINNIRQEFGKKFTVEKNNELNFEI